MLPEIASEISWQEAIDLFVADRSDLSPGSLVCYRSALERFSRSCGCPVTQTGRLHVARYLSSINGKSIYNTHLSAIKSFFDWASDCFEVKNCAARIRPQKEIRLKTQRTLTSEEYQRICSAKGKVRDLAVFLCNTGLRLAELCDIRPDHVDLEHRELRVMGKGRKVRIVPLNRTAVDLLTKYHEFTKSRWTTTNNLKYLAHRVGIQPFTAHCCRRYFATRTLDLGAPLALVSKVLGHSSVATTIKYYYHPKELHQVTDLLDQIDAPP